MIIRTLISIGMAIASDCIFCKIVNKEIPAHIVYEDEMSVAFLDINPVTDGHLLIIPKEHHEMMHDTPDPVVSTLFVRAKHLMNVLRKAMNSDYVVVSVVGIDVPHFHIHLTPRMRGDDLENFWPTKKYEEGQAEDIRNKIIDAL